MPTDGQQNCPLTATTTAHRLKGQYGGVRQDQQPTLFEGYVNELTPDPANACVNRTESPLVWQI